MDLIKKLYRFLQSKNIDNKNKLIFDSFQCEICKHTNNFQKETTLLLGYYCNGCGKWNMIS